MSEAMTGATQAETARASKRFLVYFPSDLAEKLERLALREHRRVGPQIVWLVEQAIEQRAQETTAA